MNLISHKRLAIILSALASFQLMGSAAPAQNNQAKPGVSSPAHPSFKDVFGQPTGKKSASMPATAVKDGLVDLSSMSTQKFDDVIKKDPVHKPIYMLHRATLNMFQGKPQKALEDVDQVLKYNDADLRKGACPSRSTIQKLRITALHKLGRFADAYTDCNTVLREHPTDEQARLARAMAEFELGKYKEAIDDAGQIRANPKLVAAAKIIAAKAKQKLTPQKKGKSGK